MPRTKMTGDPAPLTLKEWYTIKEAARLTGRHATIIQRWINQKRIPADYLNEGEAWPHPYLLSPLALALIVSFPKRNRVISPDAYRPAATRAATA